MTNDDLIATPHKTFLLAVCVIGGLVGALNPRMVSPSITASFPSGLQPVWFVGLAVTSIAALGGMALRRRVWGLLWERVALGMQGVLLVAYGVAVIGFVGIDGGLGGLLFYSGFAAANFYRAWIITKILSAIPEEPRG